MRRSILTLVLCILCLCPLFSQEAFYIYRNDGDFNGFFYDEVVEMRYSKLALDSVEYEQYVTYEIELADTVYRIPLAAIDSIGFQQPEIIFNENLRHMDLLEMTPYVLARDSQTLTFSNELPTSLMPQVGNVLVGFTGILEEGGFGGRVTSVTSSGNTIIVQTEELTQLSDVFVQFITIEQVGYDESGQQVMRRIAGENRIRQGQGGTNLTLFNISTNLHLPLPLENENFSITIDAGISLKAKLSMVYMINDEGFFVKASTSEEFAFETGFDFKVHGDDHKDLAILPGPLNAIKFPAALPIFELRPFPVFGVRWGGEINVKVHFPTIGGRLVQSFTLDNHATPQAKFTSNCFNTTPQMSNILDVSDNTSVELTFEGFVQCGIKFDFGIHTNSWFSKIASAGMGAELWVGPKADASLNINNSSYMASEGPYALADSHLGLSLLSLDLEANAYTYNTIWKEEHKYTWGDANLTILPRVEFYMFPKFFNFQAKHNDTTYVMTASWNSDERLSLWPSKVGIAMYDGWPVAKIFASDYSQQLSFGSKAPEKWVLNVNTSNMSAGWYRVAPSIMAFGGEYPVRSMEKKIYVPIRAKADKDKVVIPAAGGTADVKITTNGVVNIPPQNDPKISVTKKSDSIVTITVAEPNTLFLDTAHFQPVTISVVDDPEDVTSSADISVEVAQAYDPHIFKHIALGLGTYIVYEDTIGEPTRCHVVDNGDELHISGSYDGSRYVPFMGGLLGIYPLVDFEFSVADPEVINNTPAHEYLNWSFSVTINKKTKHVSAFGSSKIHTAYSCDGVIYNLHNYTSFSMEGECGNNGQVTVTSGSGQTDSWGSMSWPSYGDAPTSTSNSVTEYYGIGSLGMTLMP